VVLRGLVLLVAVGLGAVGVWLIAKGGSAKQVQIGAFAEFWALFLGAWVVGIRRNVGEESPEPVHTSDQPGTELALRVSAFEVERVQEAAARREYQDRLELMLRREIQTSVAREVTSLRDEISQLRSELLEKVGGQLRLERIETTRVIGSDLEELQRELRELKFAARDAEPRRTETTSVSRIVEPARVRPVTREAAEFEADVQPARIVEPARPERPEPARPEPVMREPARPEPARPEPARPVADAKPVASAPFGPLPTAGIPAAAPTPVAQPPVAQPPVAPTRVPPPPVPQPPVAAKPVTPAPPAASPGQPPAAADPRPPAADPRPAAADPRPAPAPEAPKAPAPDPAPDPFFADLPRIRPFTDFELDPIDDPPPYTGRRRRTAEEELASGRHSRSDAEPPAGRRRAPESGDELLARLLGRENARG